MADINPSSAPEDQSMVEQPRFSNPPVVETVMGVYFRSLPPLDMDIAPLIRFYDKHLSRDFPEVETRSALDSPTIALGPQVYSQATTLGIRWRARGVEPIRLWAKSAKGDQIIQLQNGALLANWLRDKDPGPYLDYDERRSRFSKILGEFIPFLKTFGAAVPTMCTMKYVNHIPIDPAIGMSQSFRQVFRFCSGPTSDGWLPDPDMLKLQMSFEIPPGRGKLEVDAAPSQKRETAELTVRVDMNAYVKPLDDRIESLIESLNIGHELIVFGFTSITTDSKHKQWGRQK